MAAACMPDRQARNGHGAQGWTRAIEGALATEAAPAPAAGRGAAKADGLARSYAAAFDPDGRLLYVGGARGLVTMWQARAHPRARDARGEGSPPLTGRGGDGWGGCPAKKRGLNPAGAGVAATAPPWRRGVAVLVPCRPCLRPARPPAVPAALSPTLREGGRCGRAPTSCCGRRACGR
jgi:hypothetical protein